MRCLTIFSSVSECSSLSASRKLQIFGLAQVTILLKPLCHPSARLEDQGSPHMVASHWFQVEEGREVYQRHVYIIRRDQGESANRLERFSHL